MNDGTNIASDDIILKPKFRYWLMTVSYTHLQRYCFFKCFVLKITGKLKI